ncbi:MAG: gliding motility-associated C-terminal domain-containing protein, partial [Prevotellaceae bacterium]|nr:gliding motility-associated C-terminal domain-containing protein [Prevotellaceae bacterium]
VHVGSTIQVNISLPDTLTLCEGNALTLSLAAENIFRSRWIHNGDTLSTTDSSYHVAHVSLRDTGLYVVQGYNGCGLVSDSSYIVVSALPRFTVQPRDTSLCGAGTATLTAYADNITGAIQWYKSGVVVPTTGSVLSTTDAGFYYALAQNSCGVISSDTVEVAIFATAPIQTLSLNDTTVCESTRLQLTVGGSDVFRYAWRHGKDTLAVSASGSHALSAATLADAGKYYVTGYNACGSFTDSALVGVTTGVSVLRVSRDTFLCAGENYTLTVQATGYDSIAWFFGGKKISSDSSYRINSINTQTSGSYRYTVYGHGACSGYPVSDTVRVMSDNVSPALRVSMKDISLCGGDTLKLVAKINNARTYLWLHNNALLSATDSLLQKSAVALSDSGTYIVEGINGCGSVFDTAKVSVRPRAKAIARYAAKTLCFGDSLSLRAISVDADTFYWERNGLRLSDSTNMLTRKNISVSDTGLYTFIAVNGCNSDTVKVAHVSAGYALQQRTLMPDVLMLCEGDTLRLAISADNAAGYSWFRSGVRVVGASDSAYSIGGVATSDTGLFVAQAYNACGTLSDTVRVGVLRSVEIIARPRDTSLCNRAAAVSFTVVAKNEDSIVWSFRGQRIAEGATLALPQNAGAAYSGYYRYEVYGQLGCSAVALSSIVDSVWLHIPPHKPDITARQGSLAVCEGAGLTVALSASHLFRCAWTHNGRPLPLTGSALSKAMEPSDTGLYCVEGYNACGSVFDTVRVALVPRVSIRSLSPDTAICQRAPLVDFAVEAEHADSIEWRFRGALVARGSALSLANVHLAHSGYYACTAYGRCGSLTDSVRLFVSGALSQPRGSVQQRDSIELCLGDDLELTYAADNVFRNRWRHNGALLPAEHDSTYRKPGIAERDAGWYAAEAYNGCNVLTDSVYVSIATMPRAKFIVRPPDTAFCGVAQSPLVTFAFAAQGYEPSSIRWYHSGSELPFMRDSFITVRVDDMGKAGMYRYEVISEGTCRKIVADSVELAISSGLPTFGRRLGSDTTICGSYLSDLAVSVNEFYRNRWYCNDSLILEGRDTLLRVSKAGDYRVVSYNGCGAVSDSISVQIFRPVRISEISKDEVLCFDATLAQPAEIRLTAAAEGDSLREARWYHGKTLLKTLTLSGGTSLVRDTLTVLVSSEDEHREGDYRFVVGSLCGDAAATMRVDVRYGVRVAEPLPAHNAAICEGAGLAFSFAADNALRYAWYKDNDAAPLPGADSTALIIPSLAPGDAGLYVVVADNGCYAVSDTIRLAVNPLPQVNQSPASVVVFDNAPITLAGSAAHADRRQWLYGGRPVADIPEDRENRDHIAGAATDTLTIWYASSLKHTGVYRYVAGNGCGSDTSAEASVLVKDASRLQLSVRKTAWNIDGSPITAGVPQDSMLMFRVLVANSGLRYVANLRVEDSIPAGLELMLDGMGSKVTGGRVIRYTLADTLHPNKFELLEYRVKAVAIGAHTNRVQLSYFDPALGAAAGAASISDSATVTVRSEKDIEVAQKIISISADERGYSPQSLLRDSTVSVGDYVTYRITVANVGKGACRGVVLTAFWYEGVKFVKLVRNEVHGVQQQEDRAEFTVGAIAADSAVAFEIMVRAMDERFTLLSAHATSGESEVDTLNNSAALKVRIHGLAIRATTITPNGDGHNDRFEIPFALSYPDNRITIFNRTGNMVYAQTSYHNEFSGEGLPDGTYYYIFTYRDEKGKQHKFYGPLWITRLY